MRVLRSSRGKGSEMGLCGSAPKATPESRAIDRAIRDDRERQSREIKLLLLGTGASGKSTIAKQMKILHLDGYAEEELIPFTDFVHHNVVQAMKTLVRGADRFGYQIDASHSAVAEKLRAITPQLDNVELTPDFGGALQALFEDPAIGQTYSRATELQLDDSAGYFLKQIDRLSTPGYVPTQDDALHVRIKTTGLREIQFATHGHAFRVVDVGGQRSERRKWIHCFQDVTAILFVAALNDYAMMLEEDHSVNRMIEAVGLFAKVINNHWFEKTPIVLFLNKVDLFGEILAKHPITMAFPDYDGPNEEVPCLEFIEDKFKLCTEAQRSIYVHRTCATNTENIEKVWAAVRDIGIKAMLGETGIVAF